MKSPKISKVFFTIIALLLMGLFIYAFLLFKKTTTDPQNLPNDQISTDLPISSVYRQDLITKEYVSDEGYSWQNTDFSRYIDDSVLDESELKSCFYIFYDNLNNKDIAAGERKCNADLNITVGEGKQCQSQGEAACTLYVYAVNEKGIQGKMTTVVYNIDWGKPKIGKVFTKESETYPIRVEKGEVKTYKATVSDNSGINYCWFYFDNNNAGKAKIEPSKCGPGQNCVASLDYSLNKEELHNVFVRCADLYDSEREDYLNLGYGELAEITISQNHSPELSSCRVYPSQGATESDFRFEVIATDSDNDNLSYSWDFGDGESSVGARPIHKYKNMGTYKPKVVVTDGNGGQNNCSTAWVVVSE